MEEEGRKEYGTEKTLRLEQSFKIILAKLISNLQTKLPINIVLNFSGMGLPQYPYQAQLPAGDSLSEAGFGTNLLMDFREKQQVPVNYTPCTGKAERQIFITMFILLENEGAIL